MDQAYFDKLDGNVTTEFWNRMDEDWQQEKIRLARSQASQQPLGAPETYELGTRSRTRE